MPPDERAEEVDAWLVRARQDLRAAHVGLGTEPPLSADAAFHCQQAVEKALKASRTYHDHPFRNTHDIGELVPGVSGAPAFAGGPEGCGGGAHPGRRGPPGPPRGGWAPR